MNATKKTRERTIIDEVYAHRDVFEIRHNERPDFLVRRRRDSPQFGVEVTEFYHSESQARLDRIGGYVGHLLDGGPFKHKDDRRNLDVGRAEIWSADGELRAKEVPVIRQAVSSLAECAERVADVIRKKNQTLEVENRELTHINLIVRDRTGLLRHRKPSDFYAQYCTDELRRAVFESRFREVFFVTGFNGGEGFIPLKMIMALAQLYLCHGFLVSSGLSKQVKSAGDLMRWFAHYLCTLTAGEIRIREQQSAVEVLHGDTGFLIGDDGGVIIREYRDDEFPRSRIVLARAGVDDPIPRDELDEYHQTNTFESGLAFAVRTGEMLESEENA